MTLSASVLIDGSGHLQFSYAIPAHLRGTVAVGSRVRIPLRTRKATGTVLDLSESDLDDDKIRPVESVIGTHPILTPNLLELAQWISRYYAAPLETVLRSVLPEAVRSESLSFKTRKCVALAEIPSEEERLALTTKAPRQAETLDRLASASAPIPLADLETGVCRALERKGWVSITDEAVQRDPHGADEFLPSSPITLNPDQQESFDAVAAAIDASGDKAPLPFLLHGVTGSGKTEVYLQLISKVLDAGGSALVLVPEISLTPQTVERFKSRFSTIQDAVAVLHSHLSQGERHDEWHKVLLKKARIVIGARSAVFAPLDNLGLIVVDEEHENSYKQDTSPRYHGRDIAVVRAAIERCPVLLGSATPSLESFENTRRGKYRLLTLPQRADNQKMPLIRILDMRAASRGSKSGPAILSEKLRRSIDDRVTKGEQCILFLNRRGFATSLVCQECGFVCECNHCSVALTFHRTEEKLLCHVCGFQRLAPTKCPGCSSASIRFSGYGTEKVEAVLRKVFPGHRIARVDTDTMKRKNLLRDTLRDFKAGKIDILIGTQMIAKGLHFPNVTLVGILNADVGLHMPDFRAGERTFQLLTQVAGRAGRGEILGEVVVQTFTPHSPSIQFARHHDFEGFAEQELEFRKNFRYPPFTHAVLLTTRGVHEARARFSLETLTKRFAANPPEGIVMGEPMPAPLEKAAGQYRFQLLLRATRASTITRHLEQILEKLTFPSDVILTIDVDPYQLL